MGNPIFYCIGRRCYISIQCYSSMTTAHIPWPCMTKNRMVILADHHGIVGD